MLKIFKNRKLMTMVIFGASLLGLLLYSILRPRETMTVPVIFMVIFALISGVTAFLQTERKDFLANHSSSEMLLFALVGALLMLVAGIAWLIGGAYVKGACAILSCVCIVWLVLCMLQHRQPLALLPAALLLVNGALLVVQFREWSNIPQVGCYVYLLFATCCMLVLCYQLLAFRYEIGSRRQALFCSMFGAFLCISALSNGGFASAVWYLGWGLFFVSEFDNLMFKPKKRRKPKKINLEEQPEEPAPAEEQEEPEPAAEPEDPGYADELQTLPEEPGVPVEPDDDLELPEE